MSGRVAAVASIALCLHFASASAARAAPAGGQFACRIQNGSGEMVELPNCLPSCDDKMTEACCVEIAKLGAMNGLKFTQHDEDFKTHAVWAKGFLGSTQNACVFATPGRFSREGAIRPETGGIKHVILEGTKRNSCDGGATLQKGTMVHFACTNVRVTPTSGGWKGAVFKPAKTPVTDCSFDSVSGSTLVKTFKTGFFHLPRGISDTAQSKTGNATLSDKELSRLASDIEVGDKGIVNFLNAYVPDKKYFRVEVRGQASCGVGADPKILEYCKPSRASQQKLADSRLKSGYPAYVTYLASKAGWKKIAKSATEATLTKTLGGKLVTIKVVPAGGEVKECKSELACKDVQGMSSFAIMRENGK